MSIITNYTRGFKNWSMPVMVLDPDLKFAFANDAYLAAVHKTFDDIDGVYVFDAFPETDDRIEPILNKFKTSLRGEITHLDAQPFQLILEDGSHEDAVWRATQDPLRAVDGTIIGMIQRCEDVTLEHKLSLQNKAIAYELTHRVKNITAVVSSVARITGRTATDIGDFVDSFTSRLNAMDRTNELLAHVDWKGVNIDEIMRSELEPYDGGQAQTYTLAGPEIQLSIDATKDLSLLCHELATNAAKHGCFAQEDGTLDVKWSLDQGPIIITWTEHCPEGISEPTKEGFGSRLFRLLPHVSAAYEYRPTGLHLTITMDGENAFA